MLTLLTLAPAAQASGGSGDVLLATSDPALQSLLALALAAALARVAGGERRD